MIGERGTFEPSTSKPLGMRCRLETKDTDFDSIDGRYRYMYTTLDERARSLDKHLLKLQDQLCLLADIPEGGLHPVGLPSQEAVWVGRSLFGALFEHIHNFDVLLRFVVGFAAKPPMVASTRPP